MRRTPEDTMRKLATLLSDPLMHLEYLKVLYSMLFRSQSTKLHFVVPRGTPNDSSVKYVPFWFPDFVSEGVFTISYAVPHAHDIQNFRF